MFKKICLCLLLLGVTACTTRTTQMDVIVPRNSYLQNQNLRVAEITRNVHAEKTAPIIVFFPIGFPNFEEVVNEVLQKGNGDAIVNARISHTTDWFILFGFNKISMTGDVVRVGGKKQ